VRRGREADNECFAEAFVDIVGVDALAAVVTPDEIRQNPDTPITELGIEISEDDGNALYDQASECADMTLFVAAALVAGQGLEPETEACVEGELNEDLNEDLVRRVFAATITEDADSTVRASLEAELAAVMAPCLPPGTLSGD
jgi:hypothetical protein